jgi:hypothetical protein
LVQQASAASRRLDKSRRVGGNNVADLAHEIEDLLVGIDETQDALDAVYRDKREAIRRANAPEIDRLTKIEEARVADLQVHLRRREQILLRARQMGLPFDSLTSVVRGFREPLRQTLLASLERTRQMADANRRESWILWIVCKQSLRFCSEVVELIANGGRRAPVYSTRPGATELSTGGALLDAKA